MSRLKNSSENAVASLGKIPDGPMTRRRYVDKLRNQNKQPRLRIDRQFNKVVPESLSKSQLLSQLIDSCNRKSNVSEGKLLRRLRKKEKLRR